MLQQLAPSQLRGARPPDAILSIYDHFIGEAPGTRIRTHNWTKLREWAREHATNPNTRVYAVIDDE